MLEFFKWTFVCISAILFVLISYGKLFVFFKKDAIFVSDYTSSIAMFLTLYVLASLFGVVIYPSILAKCIFFGFAFSPFLLGFFAKYETEKYFTMIQLIVFVLSAGFVLEF